VAKLRRRKRVNVGSYKWPAPAPAVSSKRMVEEGLLIANTAARMAVKNRMIVSVIRDGQNFDPKVLAHATREELLALAAENDETADRLERAHTAAKKAIEDRGTRKKHDAPPAPDAKTEDETEEEALGTEHRRKPSVYRKLAAALRAEAEDPERVTLIVDWAREHAWREVGRELRRRLKQTVTGDDPDYAEARPLRIRALVEVDLRVLANERAALRREAEASPK
jgi:hypothetical protein